MSINTKKILKSLNLLAHIGLVIDFEPLVLALSRFDCNNLERQLYGV